MQQNTGIPIEELDSITRQRLVGGIDPLLLPLSQRVTALGKVLQALKGLSNFDALWTLQTAKDNTCGEAPIAEKTIPPIEFAIKVTAESFYLTAPQLKGRSRIAQVALARQVSMFLLWKSDNYTLEDIGKALGGRTSSTVFHGYMTVMSRMKTNSSLRLEVNKLLERLK